MNRRGALRRWGGALGAILSLFFVVSLVTAPSAAAEDDCSGSFVGFEQWDRIRCVGHAHPEYGYWWWDLDSDDQPTALHLANCNGNPDIGLYKWVAGNWVLVSTKRFYCLNTDGGWLSWGTPGEGYYCYAIVAPRSPTGLLDVGYFHAGW